MPFIFPFLLLFLPIFFAACQPVAEADRCVQVNDSVFAYSFKGQRGELCLMRQADTLYTIVHRCDTGEVSRWEIRHAVYRFDCGDLTVDGLPEICVGIIKPTRYWPKPERRLFIFHLWQGRQIRPLWLGSRVSHPLADFRVVQDSIPALIQTTEYLPDSSTVQLLYRYHGFGLQYCE